MVFETLGGVDIDWAYHITILFAMNEYETDVHVWSCQIIKPKTRYSLLTVVAKVVNYTCQIVL